MATLNGNPRIEEIKNLVIFLNNYAESHTTLLPGGYKRDTIQLLPSSTTKKVYTSVRIGSLYQNLISLLTLPVHV